MAIESTRSAFRTKNDVLRRLLGKYVRLDLLTQDEDTNRMKVLYTVPSGWSHRPSKTSTVGQVTEAVLISDTPAVAAAMKEDATACDLYDAGGNRTRFYFDPPALPAPPDYQWVLDVKPNRADTRAAV